MYLLDRVSLAASLLSELAQVKRYLELRRKIQKACPEQWQHVRRLELGHWKHFGGIYYALKILRRNLTDNPDLPEGMSHDIQLVTNHEAINDLENIAKELASFIEGLSSYLSRPEANLQVGKIDVSSALRRELLNIKGCFIGSEELKSIRSALSREAIDVKNAELYEQEMIRRNIMMPVSPESYNLALEISGREIVRRRALLATKQLLDMLKTIQELLFLLVVYGQECSFHIDGEPANLQYEDNHFGRLVQCHMVNIPPLMIPGQILRFIESSASSSLYVAVLSVNWHYNGEIQESTIELTGIDLEQAGPNLLSRFS